MPELTMTLDVPPEMLGHAIVVTKQAGFVAEPTRERDIGNLSIRSWNDDGDGDAQGIYHALVLEALEKAGIEATIRSTGVVISSGKRARVLAGGKDTGMKIICGNDADYQYQLEHIAKSLGVDAARLRLDPRDDPYRELLPDD